MNRNILRARMRDTTAGVPTCRPSSRSLRKRAFECPLFGSGLDDRISPSGPPKTALVGSFRSVITFKRRSVPFRQIRSSFVGALAKLQDAFVWLVRGSDIVILQDEF